MKDEEYLLMFGENIKKERANKKISQEQLALLCNLDRTYISGIERGKRNVSLLNIVKIANSLNIPIHNLLISPKEPQ